MKAGKAAGPPSPHAAFEAWVAVALDAAEADARARTDLGRKARFVRAQIPRLSARPVPPSLKGLTASDLTGWADRLEQGARA